MCFELLRNPDDPIDPSDGDELGTAAALNWHFTAAMIEMGRHHRDEALEHLSRCRNRVVPGNIAWDMGDALYRRMSDDKRWPSWLSKEGEDGSLVSDDH